VQLWVALPDSDRDTNRDFEHFVPEVVSIDDARLHVFLGQTQGISSPVKSFTPLLGAQLDLDPYADVALAVANDFEHGVLLDEGQVEVGGIGLDVGDVACQATGATTLHLRNTSAGPARVLLLGGTPFTDELVMWWNFVGRNHDDIVSYRRLWESHAERFGAVQGYVGTPARLPAPALPNATLRPRPAPRQTLGREDTTTVAPEEDRFTIAVEGQPVGSAFFADRDRQRVFYHTEVEDEFEGRGLATILVGEALSATKDADMRIVPVCKTVAGYIDKHQEFADLVDPPTPEIEEWVKSRR
jgi:predicted GNAT family acetyltransferase